MESRGIPPLPDLNPTPKPPPPLRVGTIPPPRKKSELETLTGLSSNHHTIVDENSVQNCVVSIQVHRHIRPTDPQNTLECEC